MESIVYILLILMVAILLMCMHISGYTNPEQKVPYLTTVQINTLKTLLSKQPTDIRKVPTFLRLKSWMQALSNAYYTPSLISTQRGIDLCKFMVPTARTIVNRFIETYDKPIIGSVTSSEPDPCNYAKNVYFFMGQFDSSIAFVYNFYNDPGLKLSSDMFKSIFPNHGPNGFIALPSEITMCPQFRL